MGGFSTRPRSRPRAGDLSDISIDDLSGFDESAGLDTDTPDFSDVVGGSSSTADFSTMGLSDLSLGGLGGLSQYLPSIARGLAPAASAAAAGVASAASSPRMKRAIRAFVRGGGGRRRINPGNFKALRRAMHRLTSFERAAKRVLHFTHPRPGAKVKWKFRRRRKR
jgi:hypothetical protein